MGIGGNSVNGQNSSPKNWVSPVSYGGNINLGNIANGGIDQNGSSKAEGGKFDMSLKIPMPKGAKLQLQNLDWMSSFGKGLSTAAEYGSSAYKMGK